MGDGERGKGDNRPSPLMDWAKGASEVEDRLPRPHGDVHHRDEQQIVHVNFTRTDGPARVRARFHIAVFVLLHQTT